MAERVVRHLIDDLDGSEAVTTVRFGYAGRTYEIDLNEEHAGELDDYLAAFIEHARRLDDGSDGRRSRKSDKSPRSRPDMRTIREWARQQGLQVSDRGRIPADIVAKYEAAHAA